MVSQWKTIGYTIKNQWFLSWKPNVNVYVDVDVYVDENVNVDVNVNMNVNINIYVSGGDVFFFSPPPHNCLVPQ